MKEHDLKMLKRASVEMINTRPDLGRIYMAPGDVIELGRRIRSLVEYYEGAIRARDHNRECIAKLVEERDSIREELRASDEECVSCSECVGKLIEERDSLKDDLSRQIKGTDSVVAANRRLSERLEECFNERDSLSRALADYGERARDCEAERDSLKAELDKARESAPSSRAFTEVCQERDSLKAERDEFKRDYDLVSNQCNQLGKERDSLQKKLHEAYAGGKTYVKENGDLVAQLAAERERLQRSEETIDHYKRRWDILWECWEKSQAAIKDLKGLSAAGEHVELKNIGQLK